VAPPKFDTEFPACSMICDDKRKQVGRGMNNVDTGVNSAEVSLRKKAGVSSSKLRITEPALFLK